MLNSAHNRTETRRHHSSTIATSNNTMTERLDRIEILLERTALRLESTALRLNQTAEQQAKNTEDIDTLLGAVSTTEIEVQKLLSARAESDRRFEVLRQEAIADRQRSDQRHEENQRKFDAQMEIMRSLLAELSNTNSRVENLEQRAS
jgi:hypothetical protein